MGRLQPLVQYRCILTCACLPADLLGWTAGCLRGDPQDEAAAARRRADAGRRAGLLRRLHRQASRAGWAGWAGGSGRGWEWARREGCRGPVEALQPLGAGSEAVSSSARRVPVRLPLQGPGLPRPDGRGARVAHSPHPGGDPEAHAGCVWLGQPLGELSSRRAAQLRPSSWDRYTPLPRGPLGGLAGCHLLTAAALAQCSLLLPQPCTAGGMPAHGMACSCQCDGAAFCRRSRALWKRSLHSAGMPSVGGEGLWERSAAAGG